MTNTFSHKIWSIFFELLDFIIIAYNSLKYKYFATFSLNCYSILFAIMSKGSYWLFHKSRQHSYYVTCKLGRHATKLFGWTPKHIAKIHNSSNKLSHFGIISNLAKKTKLELYSSLLTTDEVFTTQLKF